MKLLGYFLLCLPFLIIFGAIFYKNYKAALISLGITLLTSICFVLGSYLIDN